MRTKQRLRDNDDFYVLIIEMPPNALFANHLKVIGKIPFIATYIFKVRTLIIDGRMTCFADKRTKTKSYSPNLYR